MKSILVIFGKELPKKSKKWYRQFDEILSSEELENFIAPGSFEEAYRLASELPNLVIDDGRKISQLINYKGYDLWWMHFEGMHYGFCLPLTQYRNLLTHLKDFDKIYLFEPPHLELFQYFLEAYNRECITLRRFQLKDLMPLPFGVFLQILLSLIFLPWLMIARPGLMVWIGDKLVPSRDYDFRMEFVYEELRKRNIHFVEFIRSLERWPVVLEHAWRRKRPVFYSAAVIEILHLFFGRFKQSPPHFSDPDSEKRFWFFVAAHGLRNIRENILAIKVLGIILRLIGVKIANITVGIGRTFHEVLACKLNNVKIVGIQHGAISKYYLVSDFMPGFEGKKNFSVDKYGLWSEWWRDYYIKNSNAYNKEQLFVSGPMRPLSATEHKPLPMGEKLRVLYISEEAAFPREIVPYILTLLESKDFELYFKFRPYRDGFELWLKENLPDVYRKILETTKVLRGSMEEAISLCDVVVGSYSTAVLEALLQLKPFVYYLTQKWGDCYDIKSLGFDNLLAKNPKDLIEYIKKSQEIPKEDLKKLQERFFGNPRQNGSVWVVDMIEKYLYEKTSNK